MVEYSFSWSCLAMITLVVYIRHRHSDGLNLYIYCLGRPGMTVIRLSLGQLQVDPVRQPHLSQC